MGLDFETLQLGESLTGGGQFGFARSVQRSENRDQVSRQLSTALTAGI